VSRALVLSGGGPVGIGWESGVTAALADAAVDLTLADLIVGTSAGSVVGAQIALGRDPREHIERYRGADENSTADAMPVGLTPIADRMVGLMGAMAKSQEAELPERERLAIIGEFALSVETAPEEDFVATFSYLAVDGWPRRYRCTAIDASDGTFVAWDESSGADLVRAVASSCAVPGVFPPVSIGGRRYIDGGMRTLANADLATGHDRVLIVTLVGAPPPGATDPRAVRYRRAIETEHAVLLDAGATIEVIAPDEETRSVIGFSLMDPTLASAAFEAGLLQGARDAERVAAFWT
jgi:NTE family protein